MDEHWKNTIKQAFSERKSTPKPTLWDEMERLLEADERKTKRRTNRWWLVASVVISFAIGSWFFGGKNNVVTDNLITTKTDEKSSETEEIILKEELFVQEKAISEVKIPKKVNLKPSEVIAKTKEIDPEMAELNHKIMLQIDSLIALQKQLAEMQYSQFAVSPQSLLAEVEAEILADYYLATFDGKQLLDETEREIKMQQRKDFFEKISSEIARVQLALEQKITPYLP